MKKNIAITSLTIITVAVTLFGCLKDKGTATYKVYTPITQSLASIRQNIKVTSPQSISSNGKMSVLGNYIYLSEPNKGIHVINNKNVAAPINESFINIPGCSDMAIAGNILYADCYSDLLAIDISNPSAIRITKIIANNFPDRRTVYGYTVDSTQAIIGWTVRDSIVSLQVQNGQGYWENGSYYTTSGFGGYSTGTSLTSASSGGVSVSVQGSLARFAVQNNYLYTVSNSTLNCLDITTPANPLVVSSQDIGWDIETIYPFNNNLFIGSQSGVFIFNDSTPTNPVFVSEFSHMRMCDPVIADSNSAYVTLRTSDNSDPNIEICGSDASNELDVLDMTNISQPTQIGKYNLTNPHGLCKDGKTLLVCDGSGGLRVYDASLCTSLSLTQTIPMADAFDVICNNGIAIVSAKDGLYQYDYSNPANVKLVSKLSLQ